MTEVRTVVHCGEALVMGRSDDDTLLLSGSYGQEPQSLWVDT